ncbi:hypothetical protein KCU87_g57, partial [Aureobasidium melanogenum]
MTSTPTLGSQRPTTKTKTGGHRRLELLFELLTSHDLRSLCHLSQKLLETSEETDQTAFVHVDLSHISLLFSSKMKQLRAAAHCSGVSSLKKRLKSSSLSTNSSPVLISQATRALSCTTSASHGITDLLSDLLDLVAKLNLVLVLVPYERCFSARWKAKPQVRWRWEDLVQADPWEDGIWRS